MITCKIYVLKHPITNMMFYVGKTTKYLNQRLAEHISDAKTRKTRLRVSAYISTLPSRPKIQVIDTIMCNHPLEKHLTALENFWINGLKSCGLPLLNQIS